MICKSDLETLNFNDILLLPQPSNIKSRSDVNLYAKDNINKNYFTSDSLVLNTSAYIPVFSAPMQNISEPKLVYSLGKLGGIGILHRFFIKEKQRYDALETINCEGVPYGISISLNDWDNELKFVKQATRHGFATFVIIDTASGYLEMTVEATKKLKEFRSSNNLGFQIACGNVVDQTGCHNLSVAGADMIRIGIGTGAQCLTSKSIGIGCPTLTSIRDCAKNKDKFPNVKLIADGGIYTPGDALKALVFGADGIMMGSLFGRAKEAGNRGVIYGMSSFKLQERMNKTKKSNEGSVTLIPKEEIKPLKEIWDEFTYGLKSGLSYLGCSDINDLHDMQIEYILSHR